MARLSAAFIILALFAITCGRVMGKDSCSYFTTLPGGCPDTYKCWSLCFSCYRGQGNIQAQCVAPKEGILPFWQCTCYFLNGAPCPTGGPSCPRPPAGVASQARNPANWLILDKTSAVYPKLKSGRTNSTKP